MKKVFCFGELLLRFSPESEGTWIKKASMPVYVGGAELNAATALAKWELPVSYCTALPPNYLSEEICKELTRRNIGTDHIIFSGNRIGVYYLPQGADLKNAGVIYDRAFSSFSELQPGIIDWEQLLKDVSWFHFSAINPALGENVADVCKEALQAASKMGITISVDLNYRSKLWQYGKEPFEVMPELVPYCDIIMGNIWSEEVMLNIKMDEETDRKKEYFLEQSERSSATIIRQYPKCCQVANTFRFDLDKGISYYATLFEKNRLYVSAEHHTDSIIDKVGSGDTFMAGLIYGNWNKMQQQEIIDFAAAAAFNKLFIKGDATTASVEEIKKVYINYA